MFVSKKIFALVFCSALLSLPPANAGVRIEHLGVNNTLVRVDGDDRYLMLPVQESNDDSRIDVLVDGRVAETIYVRLAKSRTDYSVPFDLTPYAGHSVVFNVVSPQGRSSVREAKEDACWKGMTTTDSIEYVDTETKYRPLFHHAPLYGWMNDPNGMFYKNGVWHLYYQHNPYGSKWQNMTWGHSTSVDLVSWKHEPIVIRPDGLGSIFSGSSVVDENGSAGFGAGAVVALYTSAGVSQMQSMAVSKDEGMSFATYAGNPVLTLESEARDPNMFWNENTGEWNLVLAHPLDREMLFFTSPDFKTWTYQSAFGKGLGAQGGVWECPDIFELKTEGDSKWILLCNINPDGPFGGSATQYFVGDWDGKSFTPDTDADGNVPTKWLDYGKDHYATVSWSNAPDGRRTVIGWMSNWQYAAEVPTKQFRSANTLPREMKLFKYDGQYYVASEPSPELESLRDRLTVSVNKATVSSKRVKTYRLPEENSGICEIMFDFDVQKADSLTFTLSNKAGDMVTMTYNAAARTMSFDRTKSGVTDFSEDFPAVTVTSTYERSGKAELRIFIDRSSVELFGDSGRFVMTNLVFPNEPYSTLTIGSAGANAKISNLKIYSLKTK